MAAERLGVGTQVHELKIGQSFMQAATGAGSSVAYGPSTASSTGNVPSFHTIRYDFKPASVDHSRLGSLAVDEKSVAVQVPNLDGNQTTNYSGHVKDSNKKDCVLIIDHETGEITLERLTSQILLKKTRPERPEKGTAAASAIATGRPLTPLDPGGSRKGSPAYHMSPSQAGPFSHNSRSNSPNPNGVHSQSSNDGFSGVNITDMLSPVGSNGSSMPSIVTGGISGGATNGRTSSPSNGKRSGPSRGGRVTPTPSSTASAATTAASRQSRSRQPKKKNPVASSMPVAAPENGFVSAPAAASGGGGGGGGGEFSFAGIELSESSSNSDDSSSDSDDDSDHGGAKSHAAATASSSSQHRNNTSTPSPSMPTDLLLPTTSPPRSQPPAPPPQRSRSPATSTARPPPAPSSKSRPSAAPANPNNASSMPSMTQFLNDDLQLSESDDDDDSDEL